MTPSNTQSGWEKAFYENMRGFYTVLLFWLNKSIAKENTWSSIKYDSCSFHCMDDIMTAHYFIVASTLWFPDSIPASYFIWIYIFDKQMYLFDLWGVHQFVCLLSFVSSTFSCKTDDFSGSYFHSRCHTLICIKSDLSALNVRRWFLTFSHTHKLHDVTANHWSINSMFLFLFRSFPSWLLRRLLFCFVILMKCFLCSFLVKSHFIVVEINSIDLFINVHDLYPKIRYSHLCWRRQMTKRSQAHANTALTFSKGE